MCPLDCPARAAVPSDATIATSSRPTTPRMFRIPTSLHPPVFGDASGSVYAARPSSSTRGQTGASSKSGASRVPVAYTRHSSSKPSALDGGWKRFANVKIAAGVAAEAGARRRVEPVADDARARGTGQRDDLGPLGDRRVHVVDRERPA